MNNKISDYIINRSNNYNKLIDYYDDKCNTYSICKKLNIPCPKNYYILDDLNELKKISIPNNCVIKFNNLADGKSIIIRKNGVYNNQCFTINNVINFLKKNKEQNQNYIQYKKSKIKQKIIIEELLFDDSGKDNLKDIKLYAFNGKCEYILIREQINGTFIKKSYDKNFIPVILKNYDITNINYIHDKPKYLDDIIEYGNRIAKNIFPDTFVRLDFYSTKKGPVFGEFTFNPNGGLYFTKNADLSLGKLINFNSKFDNSNEFNSESKLIENFNNVFNSNFFKSEVNRMHCIIIFIIIVSIIQAIHFCKIKTL